jgi:hypothetical protein
MNFEFSYVGHTISITDCCMYNIWFWWQLLCLLKISIENYFPIEDLVGLFKIFLGWNEIRFC